LGDRDIGRIASCYSHLEWLPLGRSQIIFYFGIFSSLHISFSPDIPLFNPVIILVTGIFTCFPILLMSIPFSSLFTIISPFDTSQAVSRPNAASLIIGGSWIPSSH
jgi:hypothetical protein